MIQSNAIISYSRSVPGASKAILYHFLILKLRAREYSVCYSILKLRARGYSVCYHARILKLRGARRSYSACSSILKQWATRYRGVVLRYSIHKKLLRARWYRGSNTLRHTLLQGTAINSTWKRPDSSNNRGTSPIQQQLLLADCSARSPLIQSILQFDPYDLLKGTAARYSIQ